MKYKMKVKLLVVLWIVMTIFLYGCKDSAASIVHQKDKGNFIAKSMSSSANTTTLPTHVLQENNWLKKEGRILMERYDPPHGYKRVQGPKRSFQLYLQHLPLKPYGEKALYYDKKEKPAEGVYDSVVDRDIGERDLHQCADAIMLLRADYLRNEGRAKEISFHFVDGFKASYSTWMSGQRISVKENNTKWISGGTKGDSEESFRKYMNMVFAYAGTPSLEKELIEASGPIEIGDIWIQGGSPGHAVIVVDVANNEATGEQVFILAQSYMPAQQTQILINPNDKMLNPWYFVTSGGDLHTPQWSFPKGTRKRFASFRN